MKIARWLAFIVPLAILAYTYAYEAQSFFLVLMVIVFIASTLDNIRLRKKLKDLGYPDDIKSRYAAQQRAKE